ncbi:MAG: hypothetical protein KJ578_03710 [Bacteroidetes bacterium]|nr:hypothetical protein [Bacteroidota bacterium]MBU1578067.1 hypothetical protein [Bacteroidota bacterium]MBU2556867.1 hypothetical protein [Bacteroidota bacterium]
MNKSDLKRFESQRNMIGGGFSDLPDEYFELLKARLLRETDKHRKPRIALLARFRYLAAAFVLLLIAGGLFWMLNSELPQNLQVTSLLKPDDSIKNRVEADSGVRHFGDPVIDSLSLKKIPNEYLILYLIESEEFEF